MSGARKQGRFPDCSTATADDDDDDEDAGRTLLRVWPGCSSTVRPPPLADCTNRSLCPASNPALLKLGNGRSTGSCDLSLAGFVVSALVPSLVAEEKNER